MKQLFYNHRHPRWVELLSWAGVQVGQFDDHGDLPRDQVAVVQIRGRYFYGFGKNEITKTAWRLGGAKFFSRATSILEVLETLRKKGVKPAVNFLDPAV